MVKKETVCVDKCIAKTIEGLWRRDIMTLNCCCGHNETNPSIIIHHLDDPIHTLAVLKAIDDRNFLVGRWDTKTDKLIFYAECLKTFKVRGSVSQSIKFVELL